MEQLYTEVHKTESTPNGTIVLIHGAGEHCGRYHHVISNFNSAGYHCVTGDLPGLGKSPGKRGHIESFNQYLDAVDHFIDEAKRLDASLPLFLLGHSMGGLIVTVFLLKRDPSGVSGMVLSSPWYKQAFKVPRWKQAAARIMLRIAPSITVNAGVKGTDVSRDEDVVVRYNNDPLNVKVVSPRWHEQVLAAMDIVHENAESVRVPVCIVLAGTDKLVCTEATESIFSSFSSHEKQLRKWPESYHELFNEPEKEEVFTYIVDWLDSHK